MTVVCLLYKIRRYCMNPFMVLYQHRTCQCRLHVVLFRTSVQSVHRYIGSAASPRCRTSQYRMTFIPLPVYLWIDIADSVFNVMVMAGFKSTPSTFSFALAARCLSSYTVLFFLLSFYRLVLWGWGHYTHRVQIALSQPCIAELFVIIIIIIIINKPMLTDKNGQRLHTWN